VPVLGLVHVLPRALKHDGGLEESLWLSRREGWGIRLSHVPSCGGGAAALPGGARVSGLVAQQDPRSNTAAALLGGLLCAACELMAIAMSSVDVALLAHNDAITAMRWRAHVRCDSEAA